MLFIKRGLYHIRVTSLLEEYMENANENNETVEAGGNGDDEVAAEMAAVNINDESDDESDSDEEYHPAV